MLFSSFAQIFRIDRWILLIIMTDVLLCSCNGQAVVPKVESVKPSPAMTLPSEGRQKATKLTELFDRRDCRNFFLEFPSTFVGLNELYGFDDEKGEAPLYGKYETHIPFLFRCSAVSMKEQIEKTVGIMIEGKWDADAIGTFQDLATELIFANPEEFKAKLAGLSESQVSSFWYFVLDGPEFQDPEVVKTYNRLRALFADQPRMVKLIDKQRERFVALGH